MPVFEAIVKVNGTLYVLIRCHGDAAIDLLSDVAALLNPVYGTDIKEIAAAFVFDADDSLPQRETDIRNGVRGNPKWLAADTW